MLLQLVPYLINFCFSDAEEKQNKESVIETNTHDSKETITNSWENSEGGRGNMSRDLVMLLWAVYNTRDAKGEEGWRTSESEEDWHGWERMTVKDVKQQKNERVALK